MAYLAVNVKLRGAFGNLSTARALRLDIHLWSCPMRLRFALLPFLALFAVTACETVEGAGRDLQTAGEVVTTESQDVQNDM